MSYSDQPAWHDFPITLSREDVIVECTVTTSWGKITYRHETLI
jgi:hypothetical protein